LTQQSQNTGRRRRSGAAECAQKTPPCAPYARTRGRSRRERQPKPPLLSRQTGVGLCCLAMRPFGLCFDSSAICLGWPSRLSRCAKKPVSLAGAASNCQLALSFFFMASGSERPADLELAVTGALEAHRWLAVFASTSSSIWCVARHVEWPLWFGLVGKALQVIAPIGLISARSAPKWGVIEHGACVGAAWQLA
jgi:hypothetical protein